MRVSWQDIRRSARTLAKHRGFTIVAVASLALAIALNTTMYSVIDALVNPKIELREPDRLYRLLYYGDLRRRLQIGDVERTLRSTGRTYDVSGFRYYAMRSLVERGSTATQVSGQIVRADLFSMLGAKPKAGRLFTFADTSITSPPPAMISERLAKRLFANGTPAVGESIEIDGKTFGVIGVLGAASQIPGTGSDFWVLPLPGTTLGVPLNMLRLHDDATPAALDHELTLLAGRLAAESGDSNKDSRFDTRRAIDHQFTYRGFHIALIAAVAAVLLVACANLANLQLARGISRARELALRSALGASRMDIVVHLLIESVLLVVAGLALGVVLTIWGVHALTASIPESVGGFIVAPQTSWRMFAAAVVASIVCTLLIGLLPAVRVSRVDPNELIKSGNGTGANRRNRNRYSLLVTAEIGLSLALLSGAALVVRQSWRIQQVRFGFDPRPLVNAWTYAQPGAGTTVHFDALSADVVARARMISGVADATVYRNTSVVNHAIGITDPGRGAVEIPAPMFGYKVVTPSYFRTFQLPIIKGRDFIEGERDVPSVIVDQQTARFLWPNSEAVGSMIKLGELKSNEPWARVVGVVGQADGFAGQSGSARQENPAMRSRIGSVYVIATARDSFSTGKSGHLYYVVARAQAGAERLPVALNRVLRGRPDIWRLIVEPMEQALGIARLRSSHNFVAAMFALFAALAIGMASLGVYGVVAHSVAERRRELGVRLVFGATPRNILNVVLREGNAIALAGIALGLLFTKYDASWLNAFIAEDDEYSALLFAAMGAWLFAVTVFAAMIPAWRATRVDPLEALRSE